jgi:hypothetical protein
MNADADTMPDLLLEQYALGELNAAEKARVEAALASDPAVRSRLEGLEASDARILADLPPVEIAAAIRRRMLVSPDAGASGVPKPRKAGSRFRPFPGIAFPAAAAALVLVGVVMGRSLFLPPASDDITRAKGGSPALMLYKKAQAGPVALSDGSSAVAGDILQIKYAAGTARYAAIASLDGNGTITWHLPAGYSGGDASSPRIEEGGAVLGSAYELDDAASFERFFIVSSNNSFNVATMAKAIRELSVSGSADYGSLRLPSGLQWRSLLLLKTGGLR